MAGVLPDSLVPVVGDARGDGLVSTDDSCILTSSQRDDRFLAPKV